jgi:hypothetical protein
VSGCLAGHLGGSEFAQLVINEREQVRGGPAVFLLDGFENTSTKRFFAPKRLTMARYGPERA